MNNAILKIIIMFMWLKMIIIVGGILNDENANVSDELLELKLYIILFSLMLCNLIDKFCLL